MTVLDCFPASGATFIFFGGGGGWEWGVERFNHATHDHPLNLAKPLARDRPLASQTSFHKPNTMLK